MPIAIDPILIASTSLDNILNPSKRLFWGFILSSIALVLLYLWLSNKRISQRRLRATFFARDYWLTRSSAVDCTYLVMNTALRLSLLIPLFGSHLLGAIWVGRLLQGQFDTAPTWNWPTWAIGLAFTLCFFIVEDASRFALHRIMHKVPWLWRFHRVHHSATTLTPLTLHRVHPIEMSLYFLRGWLVFSLVSGVFIYFAGKQLTALHILGVDALGFLFNAAGANLRHSHIPLSFGPLERFFISPVQHQIHHSSALAHKDKNFGTCLACWDKLFGSWIGGAQAKPLRFGLTYRL